MTHSDKTHISKDQELRQVEEKKFLLSEPFKLENGELSNLEIAYESYGSLNQERTNCILLCHALTGDHHAAGYHEGDEKPGWWNHLIGPGKPIDTNIFLWYVQIAWGHAEDQRVLQVKVLTIHPGFMVWIFRILPSKI